MSLSVTVRSSVETSKDVGPLFCFFPCLSPTHSWRLPEQRQSPAKHTSHLISVFALEICRHCSLLSDRKTKTRTVRFKRL